jgi:PAS domain S-box-containing protein
VRILVAEPAPRPGRAELGTVAALRRLGREVRIEVVAGAEECLAAARLLEPDIVVLDRDLGAGAARVLEALRDLGPPVVVVTPEAREGVVLDAFRQGAADCVVASPDYDQLLPVVVLEQIRRWRALRERGATEKRIDDLERFNANIIQNLNSALLVVDSEGYVTFANPMAEELLATRPRGLLGRPVFGLFPAVPRDQSPVGRTLAGGERLRGAEALIERADGRMIPVGISCAPVVEADGAPRGAVLIFQDLTEIKELQRQLLQTEKMASIGQLAAGVAHEINNPMGFIHANLAQLAEYLDDLSPVFERALALRAAVASGEEKAQQLAAEALDQAVEEVDAEFVLADCKKAVRESQEGSERIRHIVQDLRAFSHPDAARPVLADLNECLESTANLVATMVKHSVVLHRRYADLPRVLCYPMQLKQVFMNLLVNACQGIEARGAAGEAPGEIHLETVAQPDGVLVRVRDTGVGIRREHLDRIFDPFFTTKEVGVGTGLGLSTSFSIVQRHGGQIRVSSELGKGATFEVALPLRPLAAESGTGM